MLTHEENDLICRTGSGNDKGHGGPRNDRCDLESSTNCES